MPAGDRLAAIFLLLFGVLVSFESRGLAYWTANAPGPGFVPFWLGVLLAVASAVIALRSAPDDDSAARSGNAVPAGGWRRAAALLGLTAAAAVAGTVVGFVPASGLFIGITLTYLRPGEARANWTIAAIATLVIWLLFVRWLGVPLPAGVFGV